jgi:nitrous oxidase accessory protein NosD
MRGARPLAALAIAAGITLALAPGALADGSAYGEGPEHPHKHLFVSPSGTAGAPCTRHEPCRTIAEALVLADRGASIFVLGGTYHEEVRVTQRLRLIGSEGATIDASGLVNGVKLAGAGAAGSKVEGFVIEHANFEGVLALDTSHVTIEHNEVRENDRGNKAEHPEGECAPSGPIPGDCGEGVHLMGTTHSRVLRNFVGGNAGGILLTDETGPTAYNLIKDNAVVGNIEDCGITLAGHSSEAVSGEGAPQPSKAGIYRNKIIHNIALANGLAGEGAGILLAAGGPGSGVYDNLVRDNSANENGLAGITLHSHAPDQDLNGNRIIDNQASHDGLTGNGGMPGDEDAGVSGTVGILLFSAVTPLEGTVVKGNQISKVKYGIWTKNVPPIALGANTFSEVEIPLTQV